MVHADIRKMEKKMIDADFWYKKGYYELVQKNHMSLAINCFKEALSTYLRHYPAMFNLACCYEREGKLSYAIKWL